jgi:hypothetical protein
MKKVLCVLILGAAVLGAAYSFEIPRLTLSAGGGGLFTFEPGGGVKAGSVESTMFAYGGGAYGFFDATFGEAFVSFAGGGLDRKIKGGGSTITDSGSFMTLSFGAMGKFPFAITEQLSIFPLLGVEYQVYLSAKDKDGNEVKNKDNKDAPGDMNALWGRFGAGVDFAFTDSLFMRGEVVYGIRISNEVENRVKDAGGSGVDILLGHGGQVKIAVGYRFMSF